MVDYHGGNFLTKVVPMKSSAQQRPTFFVLAAQINSRTTEKNPNEFSLAVFESLHDGSAPITVHNVPTVKSVLSSKGLHTLDSSPPDSYLGQSLLMISLDVVVHLRLLCDEIHNVRASII